MLTIIDLPKKFCIARKVPRGRPIKQATQRATNVTRIDRKSISYKSLSTFMMSSKALENDSK